MAISPNTEELIAKAWFASIPERFRLIPGKQKGLYSDRFTNAAIILPWPTRETLARFFENLSPTHLDAGQRRAKAARMACGGKVGRRKGDNLTSADRPSRARSKPSMPPLPATIGDLVGDRSLMRICDAVRTLSFSGDAKG